MLSETCEACKEAGARLVRVETKLDVVLTGTVMIIIGMVTLIARTFVD